MKVGLLTTGFPRFEGDHSGTFLLTLARALVAQGHTVRVLAPEPAGRRPLPRWPGIELRWLPYARPRSVQRTFYGSGAPDNLRAEPVRWAGAASFSAALYLAARRELTDCDALLSSWAFPSGWVASELANGRPHLCICHATDIRWLSKVPGGRALARRIADGASSIWFLSEALRDSFFETAGLERGKVPSHTGPMPIEAPLPLRESRSELRRRLGIEGFTLLFLGRLVPVKGLDELLLAAAALREPVQLRVAGHGPERERLEALAKELEIDAVFEGWVAGEYKEALLQACDALVVPSRPEDGLPTVLAEARARALPIVATEAGAIRDWLQGSEDTVLVPPNDPPALSRAIEALRGRQVADAAATA